MLARRLVGIKELRSIAMALVGLSVAASGGSIHAEKTSPPGPAVPDIRTLTVESKVFENARTIRVYLPPGYDARESASTKYPALYLNDGFAAFTERALDAPRQLDELIRAGGVLPFILIGIDNAASIPGARNPDHDRAAEYLPYPDALEPDLPSPLGQRYPEFLFGEVMPLVERSFRVDPSEVGLGGSSYGAIAALYSAVAPPRRISKLLLESPPLFLFGERLTREAARATWPPQVYVGIGTRETPDEEISAKGSRAIASFVAAAKEGGALVMLNEVEGAGHDSAAWRARFPAAIRFLFGAPPPGPTGSS